MHNITKPEPEVIQSQPQDTHKTYLDAVSRKSFFQANLQETDPAIFSEFSSELGRQAEGIELIASENIVSNAVMQAVGSVLTNKYAEGYPARRYYGGCAYVDHVEDLARARAKALFQAQFVNVQPHSGAQANQAVYLALLQPGDRTLALSLASGGHLSHGAGPNLSGKWFNAAFYEVDKTTHLIDYDAVHEQAKKLKPKLIIAGGSAYPRIIDFKRFRDIADSVGAYLLVDMAHFAGLVAAGLYPNPLDYADLVTSTTHKTLRGPRGGIILTNNEALAKKINTAVFPGLQGGPLMHIIAGKAVAFGEALRPDFKLYQKQVCQNAEILAKTLQNGGLDLVSGGTDTHLILVDLRPKNLTGNTVEKSLERAGLTCNKNGIPFDPQKPMVTSGIRLGTPAATTRGFGAQEFQAVGHFILEVLDGLVANPDDNHNVEQNVLKKVQKLCAQFPLYNHPY